MNMERIALLLQVAKDTRELPQFKAIYQAAMEELRQWNDGELVQEEAE